MNTKCVTVLASDARTASSDSPEVLNENGRGVDVIIKVSAVPGGGVSATFTIQGKDPVSGDFYTLLASAAITATGTTVLRVFPGATVTANVSANAALPRVFRVSVAHSDAGSFTYSVGANITV